MLLRLLQKTSIALITFAVTFNAYSQAQPSNMQYASGGIVGAHVVKRVAANDPRYVATLTGMGKAAAGGAVASVVGTGAMVVVGAATAPAWGTVVIAGALAGAITYGISLGIDGLVKWAFGTGNTPISITATATTSAGSTYLPSSTGAPCSNSQVYNWCSWNYATNTSVQGTTAYFQACLLPGATNPTSSACGLGKTGGAGVGESAMNAAGYSLPSPITTTTNTANQTLTQAINALTAAQKAQAVNYDTMAMMLNYLWQQASQRSDYTGVPYSVTDPITSAEVQAWAQANPSYYPTVNDLTTVITDPATGFALCTGLTTCAPATGSTTSTSTSTTNNGTTTTVTTNSGPQPVTVTNRVSVDLGVDPAVGSPTLESTPTAKMILDPLFGLFPSFKNFAVPAHTGICPKPAFDVFSKHIVMDTHCTILEQYRSEIFNAMVLCFTLASLFIVLMA